VENVHAMIDREVAAGIHPDNIFVCGFSQGGLIDTFVGCFLETEISCTVN
jgi:predicted esterase